MEKRKFVIGDRVKEKSNKLHSNGDIGTIRGFYEDNIGVEFDNWDGGHSLNSLQGTTCHAGHGWWFEENELELMEPATPRRYTGELRKGMRVEVFVESQPPYGIETGTYTIIEFFRREAKLIDSDGNYYYASQMQGDWWGQGEENDDYYWYVSRVISEPEEKKPAETTSFADGFRQLEEWMKNGMPNFCLGNEDEEEQPRKHWEKCDCFRCLPERFSELYMRTLADGFAVPVPIMAHPNCKISFKNSPHKGGIQTFMDTLRSIPAKIKRILNPNYKAFYQLGWIDEDLDLTAQGRIELLNMLLDKHEAELGDLAKKEVARRRETLCTG